MSRTCKTVVFSNKAYNAIIRESFAKDPVETGGILLGHVLSNGTWIVMEVLPPGIKSIFQRAYFEYDDAFVNYLAQSVANQYKEPLELLGLWHRHPGSMDFFSTTDDGTNTTFASQSNVGAISGLVNIDPKFRLTMYHVPHSSRQARFSLSDYEVVDVLVGDDLISDEYFALKYYDGEDSELHPYLGEASSTIRGTVNSSTQRTGNTHEEDGNDEHSRSTDEMPLDIEGITREQLDEQDKTKAEYPPLVKDISEVFEELKKKWVAVVILLIAVFCFGYTLKSTYTTLKEMVKHSVEKNDESADHKKGEANDEAVDKEVSKKEGKTIRFASSEMTRSVESGYILMMRFLDIPDMDFLSKLKWSVDSTQLATIDSNSVVRLVSPGVVTVTASADGYEPGKVKLTILE